MAQSAVAAISLACLITCAGAAPSYTCVRLHDQIGQDGSELNAYTWRINSRGEVSGSGRMRGGYPPSAVRWNKAGHQRRVTRHETYSEALGINDAGQVVGLIETEERGTAAFLWDRGQNILLAPLTQGGLAAAHAINGRGQIVGSSKATPGPDYVWHAVRWDDGHLTDLGVLDGGTAARAVDINDDGVAVGWSTDLQHMSHAIRWDGASMVDLGVLPGGRQAEATAINGKGTVVGKSTYADSFGYQFHAAAWRGGLAVDLGVLPGHWQSEALGINRTNTVVGRSQSASQGPWLASVWFGLDQPPVDLNVLIGGGGCSDESGERWILTSATGINAKGEIAAAAQETTSDGALLRSAAFLLIPQ